MVFTANRLQEESLFIGHLVAMVLYIPTYMYIIVTQVKSIRRIEEQMFFPYVIWSEYRISVNKKKILSEFNEKAFDLTHGGR